MKSKILILIAISISNFCFAQKSTLNEKFLKQIKLEAKPVYIKASDEISELREDVKLSKQNLIPKSKVVKRFNELVGATMGKLTSFEAVDKKLQKAGDSYVTFMFDKEIARIAREKASEAKFNSENK